MNIVLSFDDGRSDAYDAYKIIKKYGLTASFHIVTGFVDGTYKNGHFGNNCKPLTIDKIQEMFSNGMDISSHGDKHIMNIEDFENSIEKFNSWNIVCKRIGFSIPNSNFTMEELNTFVNKNEKLAYVRVGRNEKCYSFKSKLCYLLYRVFKIQIAYNLFNKYNLTKTINKFFISSLVIKKHIKVKTLMNFIKKYEFSDYTLVIMFHSIVNNPSDQYDWSIGDFEKLCVFLKSNNKSFNVINLLNLTNN